MNGYGVEASFTADGGYTFPARTSRASTFPALTSALPAFPRYTSRGFPTLTSGLPTITPALTGEPPVASFDRPPMVTASEWSPYPDMSPPTSGGTRAYPTPTRAYPVPVRDAGIFAWFRGLFRPVPYVVRPASPRARYYVIPRTGAPLVGAGDLFAAGVFGSGVASDGAVEGGAESTALAAPEAATPWLLYAGVGLAAAGAVYLWRKNKGSKS